MRRFIVLAIGATLLLPGVAMARGTSGSSAIAVVISDGGVVLSADGQNKIMTVNIARSGGTGRDAGSIRISASVVGVFYGDYENDSVIWANGRKDVGTVTLVWPVWAGAVDVTVSAWLNPDPNTSISNTLIVTH